MFTFLSVILQPANIKGIAKNGAEILLTRILAAGK
jgi:hypothetical protein